MSKMFIGGVAKLTAWDGNDIYFTADTLTDSSIAIAVDKVDVRGGWGNVRFGVFFHTSSFTLTIKDAMFNLKHIAANVGTAINIGGTATTSETIVLAAGGNGTVVGTPVAFNGGGTIGWAFDPLVPDVFQTVTFTGQAFAFSGGVLGQTVCIKYIVSNSAATNIVIPGAIVPKTLHLEMRANLYQGAGSASTIVGSVIVDVPSFVLDGNITIDMTASGVSNIPLSGTANAVIDSTCAQGNMYAKMSIFPISGNWYDNITMLAFADASPTITVASPTYTIIAYALAPGFNPYLVPSNAGLTFVSGTPATATVSSVGVVTRVAIGTTAVNVSITAKPAVDGVVLVTATA